MSRFSNSNQSKPGGIQRCFHHCKYVKLGAFEVQNFIAKYPMIDFNKFPWSPTLILTAFFLLWLVNRRAHHSFDSPGPVWWLVNTYYLILTCICSIPSKWSATRTAGRRSHGRVLLWLTKAKRSMMYNVPQRFLIWNLKGKLLSQSTFLARHPSRTRDVFQRANSWLAS